MGSGFPNINESIKYKQPSRSPSTDSSMNEYVTTQSGPSSPKEKNDVVQNGQFAQSKENVNNDGRVSTVTTGEEGGDYTYMRSFSLQIAPQGKEELASVSATHDN